MIRTFQIHRLGILFTLVFASASAALGQGLPSSNYTAPLQSQIDTFAAAHITGLTAVDPASWTSHRTSLITPVEKKEATPQFFEVYAASLNKAVLPLATNKDPRIRLNAAIVVARVAAKAGNGGLAPVTETLLKDENDGVVLWGLQSAKYVVPAALASTDSKDAIAIGKLVLAALETRDLSVNIAAETSRNILEESYRTMLLDPSILERNVPPNDYIRNISAADMAAYLPTVQDFLDYRVKAYDGASPPQEPAADKFALIFFTKNAVWHAQTPAIKTKTLGLMVGLLKGANKQYAAAPSPEMLEVVKNCGQALEVVGQNESAPALRAAGKALNALASGALSSEITTVTGDVEAALTPTPH